MGEFFLRMLGAPPTEGGKMTGYSWSLQPIVSLPALIGILLVLLAFIMMPRTKKA